MLYDAALSRCNRNLLCNGATGLLCNIHVLPKLAEITNELLPSQRSKDCPDFITQVFKVKLQQLLDDLKEKHMLGKVIAGEFVK